MRKTLFVLSAFAAANILLSLTYSCNKPVDTCGGTEPKQTTYCYNLKDISVELRSQSGTLDSTDYTSSKNMSIRVNMKSDATTCYRKPLVNPFITAAYACSPVPPTVNYKGSIKDIVITSNANFDATHPAGTNLRAYFETDFGTDVNSYPFDAVAADPHAEFYLLKSPTVTGKHKFTVTYKMSDSTELKADSLPITISKD